MDLGEVIKKGLVVLFIMPVITDAFIEALCTLGFFECIAAQLSLRYIPLSLAIIGAYMWIKGR